ncbi:intraflagellar transport protein 20 homolog [Ctenocephalides felis]|uniref:intraflagellar transport protein 20 homolog n=1 Tax=Ctenocephalides felis TaxID=7515 RepID=UPI000E6E2586|nr:intraflagellar transport protein 20 homolog [Ctenocephalides felis]XP_026473664.1 intraflagellar transport protein 20 homolog [Ctenocephalides felis]
MSELSKMGIYFDEVNTLRVLEPQIANQTNDLSDECQIYVEKISSFYNIANDFVSTIETLAEAVEKEKMKAIGARNLLQSMSKQRENEQQQLQSQILEKAMELDRLKVEYHAWQGVELERQETLDHLLQNK